MTEMRFDPFRTEWVAFSSHRQDRTFLPDRTGCPLCPTKDPEKPTEVPRSAFDVVVFDNKFPAFTRDPPVPETENRLWPVQPSGGACEVIVYSDDHHLPLSQMSSERIRGIVDVWADRYLILSKRTEVDYVFIFENKGVEVGVTLHHPHGQIYGYPLIPPVPAHELFVVREQINQGRPCSFCTQVENEVLEGTRVVALNEHFAAFVPFAARYPYEIHIQSIRHAPSIAVLSAAERSSFASILRQVVRGYDRLFDLAMPYIMAMHQAPTDGESWDGASHFHVEFYPPYRTADRLKYLAGSEIGAGMFLNDVLPEQSARRLRSAVERGDSGGG